MLKILLITPNLNIPGGVTEFNKMLLHYSSLKIISFNLWGAGKKQNKVTKFFALILNIFRFTAIVIVSKANIVHLGPSLGSNSIKRDGIMCVIAKFFNKKVYLHWHGWNPDNEFLLEPPKLRFIQKTIFRANHITFLSSHFQSLFISKGYKNSSNVGNTFVDDNLLKDFKLSSNSKSTVNILFLSTISKNKGIYLALDVFSSLADDHNITFTIAGSGPELENIKMQVPKNLQNKIFFLGHVSGAKKVEAFNEADIYIFPSYYEGMPTSVLEAMAFGLPVVCSKVGAIPDFFENSKMGFIHDKNDIEAFKNSIKKLINDEALRNSIGRFNHKFATEYFLASKAVARIDADYKQLLIHGC
ncbi:glycosyltransferase family 1 protein [Maribellus luteus]|uniref:Glycosyltransferase family 1 protein n=1 Tax=Maribellus luteus TaxID=2305463 RepID=A0A399SUA7_9BACT|nr:glycosyltransferase family 4 protein [Maribellus luteus]RIJ47606.1 glycosyltransferase family 1 protein [Maribellus luteus]